MRPLFKTHGGKYYLARRINAQLPPHEIYVEPFAGGLSVLLNKPRSPYEYASDIDQDLINFYQGFHKHYEEFKKFIDRVSYIKTNFEWSLQSVDLADRVESGDPEIEWLAKYLVRNRFSRGGLGKDFAWSDRLRGGQPGDVNAWDTIRRDMNRIHNRLYYAKFERADALDVIGSRHFNKPNVLFYLDPPYVASTRTSPNIYANEMSEDEHVDLLRLITSRQFKTQVVLSGYHNDLYDKLLGDWRRVEFDMPNHSGQTKTKQRRIEVLWLSPSCQPPLKKPGRRGKPLMEIL
jgi:DNA adenine methylase